MTTEGPVDSPVTGPSTLERRPAWRLPILSRFAVKFVSGGQRNPPSEKGDNPKTLKHVLDAVFPLASSERVIQMNRPQSDAAQMAASAIIQQPVAMKAQPDKAACLGTDMLQLPSDSFAALFSPEQSDHAAFGRRSDA